MVKKFLILFGVLIIVVIGIVIYLRSKPEPAFTVENTIKAIPVNAAFIIESKNFYSLRKKLDSNEVWKNLLGIDFLNQTNTIYNLIGSTATNGIANCLTSNSVYISMHPTGASNVDFLYTIGIPSEVQFTSIDEYIKKLAKTSDATTREYDDASISTIKTENESISYTLYKNMLLISKNDLLVEDALRQYNAETNLLNDPGFNKIVHSSGIQADLHAYLNYVQLPICFKKLFHNENKSAISSISQLCTWSEFDVTSQKSGFSFNGIAYANDSISSFINAFIDQSPQEFKFSKILPENTAFFVAWGISDLKKFHEHYKSYLDRRGNQTNYTNKLKILKNKYGVDLVQFFNSSFKNEVVYALTQTTDANFYSENSLALIRLKDTEEAAKTIGKWCDTINTIQKLKSDTISYRGHKFRTLHIESITKTFFGDFFASIDKNNYTFIDDYLVISNTISNLKAFINDYENGRTLQNAAHYAAFSERISTESNILLYSSIKQSMGMLTHALTEEYSKQVQSNAGLFDRFGTFTLQYSRNDKFIYNSAFISSRSNGHTELQPIWNAELDTVAATKPFVVVNHKNASKELFIQDKQNTVYLISKAGKILWKRKLPERIIGEVKQVDAKKNGKLQLLFGTRSFIYLIDRNGDNVDNFPIDLKSEATNPISVFDYDKKKEYRIIVANENKKISCYNINGEQLKQWSSPKTDDVVVVPVNYCLIDGKDYITAIDKGGKIYGFDRKGESRFKHFSSFTSHLATDYTFVKGKSLDSTFIVAADSSGTIMRINLKGKITTTKPKNGFKLNFFFAYADINGDKKEDYIFLGEHELIVYNHKNEVLFDYGFKGSISSPPIIFNGTHSTRIGIVSDKTNELFLINNNGILEKNFPCYGSGSFIIDTLTAENAEVLITPNGNKLTAYLLPQMLD